MKSITKHLFLLLSFITTACSSDDLYQESTTENEINKIEAVVSPFIMDEPNTRTTFWMGNYGEYKDIVWAEGDTIGIYPSKGDQLSFPIVEGVGKTICEFNGGGWALKPSTAINTYTYTAYTPFNRNYYFYKSNNALPVSMIGQKQKGNNNPSHLGAYDLQIAKGTTPTNGKISFAFEHQVAFVRMDIVAPCKAEWKSIELESDAAFTTEAIMNLTLETPTITPKVQTNSVTLELEDVHTNDSLHLVAYMMMLPVDFTDKTLNLTLKDTDDNIYTAPVTIVNANKSFRASYYKWIKAEFKEGVEPTIPYITFTADAEQTFTMSKAVETLEYSVNGGAWTTLGTTTVIFGGNYGYLQLRGNSLIGTNSANISFGNSTSVSCLGDIRTLIDYNNYSTVNTENAKFNNLFQNCSCLVSAPKLPITSLANGCYSYMFQGCTKLTFSPELPAITLTEYCYERMFSSCTSLIYAPELPAKTLSKQCYEGMFLNCKNLKNAPELPATNLASQCYTNMFNGCKSLPFTPNLPAVTLTYACYSWMFNDCENLIIAPELPATILAESCYTSMFRNCTNLSIAPKLRATKLENYCYDNMFYGCTNLTIAPELPATTLAYGCYSHMFNSCTNLTTSPILPATTLVGYCYIAMFEKCNKINGITMLAKNIDDEEETCLVNWLSGVSPTGTFIKSTSMTSLPSGPSGIPSGWTVIDYEE